MVSRATFGGETRIARATLRALLEPRRLLPVLVVSVPLIVAQQSYSHDPRAGWLGALMCAAFVLVAPVSWRVLFPEGVRGRDALLRLALYAAAGAGVVLTIGVVVPRILHMGTTFLTARSSLLIDVALFLVGGWGLGRDIGFEVSLRKERERAAALSREAEQAQLLALRSHLDPHFLFNTLNAIAEWCREDGETAERAVLQLSAMLRTVLGGVQESAWPLAKEIELARTLLALHLLRDTKMFELDVAVAEGAHAIQVPPMLLLPLVENAVKHGPAKGHKGTIVLRVEVEPPQRSAAGAPEGTPVACRVTVRNPGPYVGPREGSHGVPTVERRLALAYDGRATLTLRADGRDTLVTVELPASLPEAVA